jgi:DNA polymerase (family 10)
MDKKGVVAVLEEMAMLMELKGENPFRIRSFVNGARTIEAEEEDLATVTTEGRLRSIKGIGEALAAIITELFATGESTDLNSLRAVFPTSIYELFEIPGLGPKRIKQVYEALGIDSMDKLEAACRADEIKPLKGMGAKTQAKILEGIEFARAHTGSFLFNRAEAQARSLVEYLTSSGLVKALAVTGSLRRRKEVIKDIDLVATTKDVSALMQHFVDAPDVVQVIGHGETKSSVRFASGISADLRVVEADQFPYTLLHFTGSKEHNVVLRQRAKERGLKLNEYGLFNDDESLVPCDSEEAIYQALGLPFIPPELREDRGEFTLTETPGLLEQHQLKGLIHCHSTYSDGQHTLEDMAEATRELGYEYLLITDHSQSAGYAGGLKPERILQQQQAIARLNTQFRGFRVLSGIESDIRIDGSLDYENDVLASFDLIIASVHNKLDMDEKEATKRVITAIENPHTAILGHPTGRLLLSRKGFPLDMEKVFDACAANKVAVEINASCKRLDVDWRYIRQGRDKGVLFSIGPDAHSIEGLSNVQYGVGIARKGWLGPEHVINCWTAEELLAWRK